MRGKFVDDALSHVLETLKNQNPHLRKSASFLEFMNDEQENAAFLISRVVVLKQKYKPYLVVAVRLAETAHPLDPTFWLACEVAGMEMPQPVISGYPKEFPPQGDNLMLATRVFVAEALASWSFYNHDRKRLDAIVAIGMSRIPEMANIKFSKGKLTKKSEFLIYYVTHVVLVATMWGELPWHNTQIAKMLESWIVRIAENANANLEVWVEVLFCLLCMGRNDFVKSHLRETLLLYNPTPRIRDPHESYHLYVLWALLFAYLEK